MLHSDQFIVRYPFEPNKWPLYWKTLKSFLNGLNLNLPDRFRFLTQMIVLFGLRSSCLLNRIPRNVTIVSRTGSNSIIFVLRNDFLRFIFFSQFMIFGLLDDGCSFVSTETRYHLKYFSCGLG